MTGRFLLVRRSLAQHKLSTAVTVLAAALACGLVMSVFAVAHQTEDAFTRTDVGYDAVLGARGSPLQLVLNTVYHLETSPGNIPWSLYQTVRKDPRVKLAIPYGVGDNFRGFRIVGTGEQLFTKFRFGDGNRFVFASGGVFDGRRREAVLGSFVAARTGLQVGDSFNPSHGVDFAPGTEHDEVYVVSGVLEATNTPNDRVVWIPLEGIWRMKGHVLRGSGQPYQAKAGVPIPDEHKEVSSVMIRLQSKAHGMMLMQDINRRSKNATLAWPIDAVMLDLFQKMFWFVTVLKIVAYLVVAVATGAILASIYNTMNERRHEFAVLRALGASRTSVFSAIVLEAASIATLGAIFGYAVYAAVLGFASVVIQSRTGVVLKIFAPDTILWAAPLGMVLLGAAAGLLPAKNAYATDVATNL
ncbi:MAG: ABC transporter permease [Planctomycetota bacterium]|jgi:putative ABC transport system permease protein